MDVKAAGNGTESDPLQQYVSRGREAVLQCIFQESKIKWVKKVNDTFILIASQNVVTDIQRYKVSSNPSTEHYSRLHVLNAQPDDEVIYGCSGLVNQMYYIQLNLYGKPLYHSKYVRLTNLQWLFENCLQNCQLLFSTKCT